MNNRKRKLSLAHTSMRRALFNNETVPNEKTSPETPSEEYMLSLDNSVFDSFDPDKAEKQYWDSQKKSQNASHQRHLNDCLSPLLFETSFRQSDKLEFTPVSKLYSAMKDGSISPVQLRNEDNLFAVPAPRVAGIENLLSDGCQEVQPDSLNKNEMSDLGHLSDTLWEESAFWWEMSCLSASQKYLNTEDCDESKVEAEGIDKTALADPLEQKIDDLPENQTVCENLSHQNVSPEKSADDDMPWDHTVLVNTTRPNVTMKEPPKFVSSNQSYHSNSLICKDLNISKLNWSEVSVFKPLGNASILPCVQKLVKSGADFNEQMREKLLRNANKPITRTSIQEPANKLPVIPEVDTFYGLPQKVFRLVQKYKGIKDLYDWQKKCLSLPAVRERRNLVYALPTSGGKTLVAEVLLLKEILVNKRNVIFVLPYVSIVQEKVRGLAPFALDLEFFIEEYASNKGIFPPRKRRKKQSVYIATIEKGLGLVNSLLQENRMDEIGLIVVDELHLLGDGLRGASLETLITKVLCCKDAIQIIAMSATIGNLDEVARFLHADVFTEDFRPVELKEFLKCGDDIFSIERVKQGDSESVFIPSRTLKKEVPVDGKKERQSNDPDKLAELVMEVVPEESVLVFCATKKNCELVSAIICNGMPKELLSHRTDEKLALYRALLAEGNGQVCSTLKETLPYGVAYHHSGLTTAERRLLEEAFLAKTICVICCTSTLAAGVNLPARRVILRSPYVGLDFIDLSRYKQMIGRAGRTGLGEIGESILICSPLDLPKVQDLMFSPMIETMSQLDQDDDGQGVSVLIMTSIGMGLATNLTELHTILEHTLLHVQAERKGINLRKLTEDSVKSMIVLDGIDVKNPEDTGSLHEESVIEVTLPKNKTVKVYPNSVLSLSKLGNGAVKAGRTLSVAKRLYGDLKKAQENLVLASHLHMLYLVTPYNYNIRMDRRESYFNALTSLNQSDLHTAAVIGLNEAAAVSIMRGNAPKKVPKDVVDRFFMSLIIYDLWREKSIWDVAQKFGLSRGDVYNLMTNVPTFASSVLRFTEEIDEFRCFTVLLSDMTSRLTHFCCLELQQLMELPCVKIGRARQLYSAGYRTLRDIAMAKPIDIAQSLDHMPRRVAHQVVSSAKLMLLAKAETLQEEAEVVLEGLQKPLDGTNVSLL